MVVILRWLALLLVMGGMVQTSTAPALAGPALPPNSVFSQLTIEPGLLRAGEAGHLYVTLKHAANQLTILNLNITYPSGATQQVVHSTLGKTATLEWIVPAKAGVGEATYQVATEGCGCGDHNSTPADAVQNEAKGSFAVE